MKSHFFIVSFPRKWWPSRHPTLSLKRLNGPGVWSPSAAPWSTCHPWNGRRPSKSCGKPGRKARIILYHYMIDDICIQPMYTTGKCRFGLLIPFHIIHIYIYYTYVEFLVFILCWFWSYMIYYYIHPIMIDTYSQCFACTGAGPFPSFAKPTENLPPVTGRMSTGYGDVSTPVNLWLIYG